MLNVVLRLVCGMDSRLHPSSLACPLETSHTGFMHQRRGPPSLPLTASSSTGTVKLTKIQSTDPQDIAIASDQERDTMGTR